jgi:hypothetical protein
VTFFAIVRPIWAVLEVFQGYLDVEITLQPFWKSESHREEYASNGEREIAFKNPAAATDLAPPRQRIGSGTSCYQE